MGKRFIKVDRPMEPRLGQKPTTEPAEISRPPGCKTIFIKNLPYECTEETIKNAFMIYGKIITVRLARWGHTNQLKGFGYIEYKKEESADIAVRKSGDIIIEGRAVTCDFETGRPKGSFRASTGPSNKKTKN